ncbi:hypothetical protein TrRE_jg6485 [Triparma retinervis]|uniref:Growth arrest-specific protein 8 domain-containing protein n=1 Tax=Triparma retinervis TaxID=2557542 RepID=A0A9W7DXW8_9STRA|nr:hypothetical protein TrRE_jg6485 [Triparma retinervis]
MASKNMPKKGKKGKKGAASAEPANPDEAEKLEMIKKASDFNALTKKEDVAFNEFQQQKEKVSYFWIIEKKRLEDKKAELRNKDRELQDLEEKHQVIIKIYKQRVKHLLYEHQNEVTSAKTDSETSLIEERKNAHIKQLMKDHEQEFSEIKNYYNDITHNNLDLIKSLKDEVAEMKKKEQADEQRMNEIHKEHTRMSEPLKKARADVEFLSGELTKYKKEKEELVDVKTRLLEIEGQHQALKWQDQWNNVRV